MTAITLLNSVQQYCEETRVKAPLLTDSTVMAEEDFRIWLGSTSKLVMELIPSEFWNNWKLPPPQTIHELFPKVNSGTTSIVQLCVWCCCDDSIFSEITNCMSYGSESWRVSEKVGDIDWIRAFVESVRVSVSHSTHKFTASRKMATDTGPVHPFQVELCCLPMAVKNSFSFFYIVTDFYPMGLIRKYEKHLRTTEQASIPIKYTCVTELQIFDDSESGIQIESSILLWYKDYIVRPLLHNFFEMDSVRNLTMATGRVVEKWHKTIKKGRQPWRESLDEHIQPLARKALDELKILESNIHQHYQLILLANYGLQILYQEIDIRDCKFGEILVMKFLSKAQGRHNRTIRQIIVKFVCHRPLLFSEGFIKAVSDVHHRHSFSIPEVGVWDAHYTIPECRLSTGREMINKETTNHNAQDKRRKKKHPNVIEDYSGKLSSHKESPTISTHGNPTVLSGSTTLPKTRVLCAAGDLCGMKSVNVDGVHKCMNCEQNMHGALCGFLWEERGENCTVKVDKLSPSGKVSQNNRGALICKKCSNTCS